MRLKVNLTELSNIPTLTKKQAQGVGFAVIEMVTNEYYENIRKIAGQELHGTRNQYLAGLQKPVFGRMTGTITLIGDLPNMLEQGARAFDMKLGFARSNKVKKTKERVIHKNGRTMIKKEGWYLTIPFRLGTPTALAENEAFSGKMTQEVYDEVKEQESQITAPIFGTIRSGGKSRGFGVMVARGRVKGLGREKNKPYQPKSQAFEGVVKTRKFYQFASQSQYVMFRRVSDNSEVNSWIHKGFEARDFFKKGWETLDVDSIKNKVVKSEMNRLGFF